MLVPSIIVAVEYHTVGYFKRLNFQTRPSKYELKNIFENPTNNVR